MRNVVVVDAPSNIGLRVPCGSRALRRLGAFEDDRTEPAALLTDIVVTAFSGLAAN